MGEVEGERKRETCVCVRERCMRESERERGGWARESERDVCERCVCEREGETQRERCV